MPNFARAERAALCDVFAEVGPDAPTLCGDWTTRDLAAHLVVREGRPDAAAGMFLPLLSGRLESVQRKIAEAPWEELVEKVRSGPPRLGPFGLPGVDEKANLSEFFIHHEDVLRAGDHPDARREVPADEQAALWKILPRIGRLTLRDSRTGVVADCPGHGRRSLRGPRDERGNVVLTGAPSEVLLYIFGRDAVTDVGLDGSDSDIEAFRATTLGF
ncbi:TIGR03085 family protein [Flexivirga endophytica]|uniref:TIGR03085 family protein n=1 Tax=Flexivirga endophytica TaxID=1849103 RepID=A0A916WVI3_9MICO|nr:TIGR03085 family metal-binding protein [Flexivirga endophytica]GGB33267.1 TIGR03085 family protein [Flexivirga endophytica]GHB41273.1 TIGR03085 family protein [Flexivirga endophytica]